MSRFLIAFAIACCLYLPARAGEGVVLMQPLTAEQMATYDQVVLKKYTNEALDFQPLLDTGWRLYAIAPVKSEETGVTIYVFVRKK